MADNNDVFAGARIEINGGFRVMHENLWRLHEKREWICVTTNGTLARNNTVIVMGAGCAGEAEEKYSWLPDYFGNTVREAGNFPMLCAPLRIISFPVKHNYWEKADKKLILKSFIKLMDIIIIYELPRVFLPKPGCGMGQLQWEDVLAYLTKVFDNHPVFIKRAQEKIIFVDRP